MGTPRLKFAELDEASLEKLRRFEEAMGTIVLAVEPKYPMAELSNEQLQRLQDLERDLGVVLIAYQS